MIVYYVKLLPDSDNFKSETVLNNIIATASLIIPYPNNTALSTGYFSGFIRDIAATVSVAHKTLLTINTSSIFKTLKTKRLSKYIIKVRQIKPIRVPTIPRNPMIPKF